MGVEREVVVTNVPETVTVETVKERLSTRYLTANSGASNLNARKEGNVVHINVNVNQGTEIPEVLPWPKLNQ